MYNILQFNNNLSAYFFFLYLPIMFNIQYKEQIREFLSRKGLTEEIVCLKALGWMNRSQAPLILFSCP